ncbi:hypothetical protein A0J61_10117 [Choanephora cucurbitarum]|uniref:F-box domain-containing protein n=1 Tax=Choanephora cucurbitarum TaxID=101091 RepID=A0A1C7N3C5_9FUNG|nr:hypothetical protein A0J61_10117 [Choanephora cucurbitarum]
MLKEHLPFEIQWKILDYLETESKIQYSLVSKHWREAARYVLFRSICLESVEEEDAFIDLLIESPSLGESTKSLMLKSNSSMERDQQYSALIRLTPNLRFLQIDCDAGPFYQVALLEIQRGHWKYLHHIKDISNTTSISSMGANDIANSSLGYHALLSATKDRLSDVVLDLSSVSHSPTEIHCFQYPLYITRQTRFRSVKHLTFVSSHKTAIKSLDDALALFPNATDVILRHVELESHEDKLAEIEPNTVVEGLFITISALPKESLNYISCKFPNVKQLVLRAVENLESLTDFMRYAYSVKRLNMQLWRQEGLMVLLDAIVPLQWQGKMEIKFNPKILGLQYNRSEARHSKLYVRNHIGSFDFARASLIAYLNQLDELDTYSIDPEHIQLLSHCTQLKTLRICHNNVSVSEIPVLPITCFISSGGSNNMSFLEHLSASAPNLRDAMIEFNSSNITEICMPSTSFHSLCINFIEPLPTDLLDVHLIRSGEETYYQSLENQLCEIGPSEYRHEGSSISKVRIEIMCKDIKYLELRWQPNDFKYQCILHEF